MPVFRTKFLPEGKSMGRLILPEAVAINTKIILTGFRGLDGPHEGMVFWLGRKINKDTFVTSLYLPECEHGPQYVMASAKAVGFAMKSARKYGLGIVAQVHTHGDIDTRHSDGDDELILMPHEGMYSVVIGSYGAGGVTLNQGIGLHQFQNGRWIKIKCDNKTALTIVPTVMENEIDLNESVLFRT